MTTLASAFSTALNDFADGKSFSLESICNQETVGEIVRAALRAMGDHTAYGGKVVVQPKEQELLKLIDGHQRMDFTEQRLNWKLSALVSVNDRYGAVKIVGSNSYNQVFGLPRSRSTILLFEKLTMQPIMLIDGTEISAARTGSYASLVADHLLWNDSKIDVFVFGAGPVAKKVIADLAIRHGHRIGTLYVKARTFERTRQMVAGLSGTLPFPVTAVEDNRYLARCSYVITASNSRLPVFEAREISENSVVLHMGGDETPQDYIRSVLEQGMVFCDDIETVCHRNSQSLALYFGSRGLRLSEEAGKYQIRNLWSLPDSGTLSYRRPALVTCVGLPVLDLYIAQYVYEHLEGVTENGCTPHIS